MEGNFQEPMGWGRWGFPLPEYSTQPSERGWRMACAAMQMMWQEQAEYLRISQVSRPERVLEFISSQPGLEDACFDNLSYLIAYAPQLVIPGFGGQFEDGIDARYRISVDICEERRARGDRFGTALSTDGRSPGCDDQYALRAPDFGMFDASHVACGFVQGNYVANGPPVLYYSHIDYAAWLLSTESLWLPEIIRETLRRGMAEWGVWPWGSRERRAIEDFGFQDQPFTGALENELLDAASFESFTPSPESRRDAEHRLNFSAKLLDLPEDGVTLADRLLAPEFLGPYFAAQLRRRSKR